MEDEDFLILDDDEESESSIPANKSASEKIINLDSKEIISGISKTVGDKIIQFKESNELKKILAMTREQVSMYLIIFVLHFHFL